MSTVARLRLSAHVLSSPNKRGSVEFPVLTFQETVEECIKRSPQPHVRLHTPNNPDLAVVQGAVHFAPLSSQLPSKTGPSVPVGPNWEALTATMSYGILSNEVGWQLRSYSCSMT